MRVRRVGVVGAALLPGIFLDADVTHTRAVYVQKAERAPVTPMKYVGSPAAASPATPATAQKAAPSPATPATAQKAAPSPATPATAQKAAPVKAEDGRPALEALLKEMRIGPERLCAAARGKSESKNGLNVEDVRTVLQHFNVDTAGCLRPELDSKLSHLLSCLGVQ
jgi:hypothetical protein